MISKQAIREFLGRDLDDYSWIKDATKDEITEALEDLPATPDLKTELYLHQLASFYLCACHEGFMLFLDMGLGKTLITLALISYRRQLGQIQKALVIVPNVVNVEGWSEEVALHSNLTMVPLYGTKEQREAALEKEADLYVINYDGLQVLLTELQEVKRKSKKKGNRERVIDEKKVRRFVKRFQMVVYDEVHKARNNESLTFRLCDRISKACKYRVGLTGTPVGRDATAFWAQFYLVDRGETLGTVKGLYLQSFFQVKPGYFGGATYKLTPEKETLLHKTLRNRSIRYADTECQDLPPLVKKPVHVTMSPDAREYYRMTVEESMEEAQEEDREKLKNYYAKWRQIASGFVYTEDDESEERFPLTFSDNQKLLALEDILDDMPNTSKIVIFHIYNQSGAMISDLLKKMKVKHVMMNAWEKDKRGSYIKFKKDPNVTALVVNIASGGEGLNLQNANYLVFYEPTDQPIKYRQAYKRVYRGGQVNRVYMYEFITRNSVEERILGFLEEGKSLFDAVVDGKIGMKRLSGMYND